MTTIADRVARFIEDYMKQHGKMPSSEEIAEQRNPRKRGRKSRGIRIGKNGPLLKPVNDLQLKLRIGREYQALKDGTADSKGRCHTRISAITELRKKYGRKSDSYFYKCLARYRERFSKESEESIKYFFGEITLFEMMMKEWEREASARHKQLMEQCAGQSVAALIAAKYGSAAQDMMKAKVADMAAITARSALESATQTAHSMMNAKAFSARDMAATAIREAWHERTLGAQSALISALLKKT